MQKYAPLFCSAMLIHWLQNHLIPCPFKWLTTIDCPGCGFQRSLFALISGNFNLSWQIYPPLIPLLLLFLYAGIKSLISFPKQDLIFKVMSIVIGNLIIINYLIKMVALANLP